MASNSAFTLQGATPTNDAFSTLLNIGTGSTPQAKALTGLQYGGTSGVQTSTPQYATNNGIIGSTTGIPSTPPPYTPPTQGTSQGLIAPTNQAVKSHTVTNADGSTVSQTYHPPETTLNKATQGLLNLGTPNPTATKAADQLVGAGDQNAVLAKRAQDIADSAGREITDIGRTGSRAEAGYRTTGTTPVAEGNAAVAAQTTAAQQQAVAQGAQQALQGVGYGLTAQGQTQSGQQAGGNLALAGTGQNITALGNAGNLSSPVSQFGVLGTPQSVGAFGSNTGSTAFQGGYIGGQQAAGGVAAGMDVANTAAKGIEGTIQQFLQSNPQLNQSTSTIANAAQQWLQGKQLGDPAYQTLFNYINEYISTLAPILGVGGDTTNLKTEIAQSFVNAKASGQSIAQVLQNISSLADAKIQNVKSAGQGGGQVAGGVPAGTNPTSYSTEW